MNHMFKNSQVNLKLFNTETRQKESLTPVLPGKISLYTCGPTVYNYAHIGNFRTYVFEDLLKRALEFFGYRVTHVMNLTDVDDKTIRGAVRDGVSLLEFTQKYKDAFFADIKSLFLKPADFYPAATDYISQMIEMIAQMLESGHAYKANDGSVYYAIRSCSSYGRLSHFCLGDLQADASERIHNDEYDKETASDFVLWKAYEPERDGAIFWESPFGKGRPGWHLECSAMAISLLGETVDIHVGGVDNMFPHHENEIAQSEACTGKKFVSHWMHSEHLLVNGQKMSKTLGNFYTLRDLMAKGYTGAQIRYFLMQVHYKVQLNFTFEGLDAAKNSLERLQNTVRRLQGQICPDGIAESTSIAIAEQAYVRFAQALADDLNISVALAVAFDFSREVNLLLDKEKISKKDQKLFLALFKEFDQILGTLFLAEESVPEEIQQAAEERMLARAQKNWKESDRLRDWITSQGYTLEDIPQGFRIKKT